MPEQVRLQHRDKPEEGAYGGKPGIPTACGIASVSLYVVEEVSDQCRIDILDRELGRRPA
jgi:hypothetical protein